MSGFGSPGGAAPEGKAQCASCGAEIFAREKSCSFCGAVNPTSSAAFPMPQPFASVGPAGYGVTPQNITVQPMGIEIKRQLVTWRSMGGADTERESGTHHVQNSGAVITGVLLGGVVGGVIAGAVTGDEETHSRDWLHIYGHDGRKLISIVLATEQGHRTEAQQIVALVYQACAASREFYNASAQQQPPAPQGPPGRAIGPPQFGAGPVGPPNLGKGRNRFGR